MEYNFFLINYCQKLNDFTLPFSNVQMKYGFIAYFYEIIAKLIVKIKFYDFESSIIGLATEMIVDKAIIISIFF